MPHNQNGYLEGKNAAYFRYRMAVLRGWKEDADYWREVIMNWDDKDKIAALRALGGSNW